MGGWSIRRPWSIVTTVAPTQLPGVTVNIARMYTVSKKTQQSGKSLVIVESPAKAKTINRYLGSGYEVMASMGHVRDLPVHDLGIDLTNDFEPVYEVLAARRKIVGSLRKAAGHADRV